MNNFALDIINSYSHAWLKINFTCVSKVSKIAFKTKNLKKFETLQTRIIP